MLIDIANQLLIDIEEIRYVKIDNRDLLIKLKGTESSVLQINTYEAAKWLLFIKKQTRRFHELKYLNVTELKQENGQLKHDAMIAKVEIKNLKTKLTKLKKEFDKNKIKKLEFNNGKDNDSKKKSSK